MNNQNNKRAVVCGVAFVPTSQISMGVSMGLPEVKVTFNGGNPDYQRPQSVSFSEKKSESGDYVDQEFECVFADTEQAKVADLRKKTDEDGIVLLKYSNGEVRVIGNYLAPVRCEFEESGTPRTAKIAFKRKSPEFSKILQSLN